MLRLFSEENPFGRNTIPGSKEVVTERRLRRSASGRKNFYHRSRNGVYDPLTYYRVLHTLMSIEPGQLFRTQELIAVLKIEHPQMVWDPTTVGRVVTDIADSLKEANGITPISFARRWNGMSYQMEADAEGRVALMNLLEDLHGLCEEELERESNGDFPKRVASPLERCASLMMALESATE